MSKTPPPTPPKSAVRKPPPSLPPKKPNFVPTPDATQNAQIEYDRKTNRPRFVKGNQLWQMVKAPTGKPPTYEDGAELWQKAVDYFNWCDANPLAKAELVKHMGDGEVFDVPLGRPYSVDAFTIFLGVSDAYFRTRNTALCDKEEAGTITEAEAGVLHTIRIIKNIIRNQRFEGAAVGVFKENLISRVDGYADHINQNNTGEVRQNVVVRDQQTADNLKALDELLK